jgi:hypothetical protein
MAISYLCKIDGTDITQYLKSYEVSYEEMWSEANRNMAGILRGSYIATSPKIFLEFRQMTKIEMSTVMGLLDGHSMTVAWFDETDDTYKQDSFYRGELKVGIRDLDSEMYKELSVNLISFGTLEASA